MQNRAQHGYKERLCHQQPRCTVDRGIWYPAPQPIVLLEWIQVSDVQRDDGIIMVPHAALQHGLVTGLLYLEGTAESAVGHAASHY
jgi:hypothetical protein